MSIRKKYFVELEEINQKLLLMQKKVISAIQESINALLNKDSLLIEDTFRKEKEIDSLERDIEQECLKILLMEHPVAGDFREVSAALKMITDLENDIKTYQEQEDRITNLENIINQSNDVGAKYLIGKEKSELEKEHNELGEALVSKYAETNEETEDVPVFDESKTSSRKILYGVVAVLAALGITIGVVSCSKQNKKPISENNTNITEVDDTKVEEGFVNISDEEAVYERASEIKSMIDSKYQHTVTVPIR